MKPPTLKFSNDCQLGVVHVDRLSDRSDLHSPKLSHQSHRCPSEASPVTRLTPYPLMAPPTEFLLNSAPSPSIGLSSLPPQNTPEKKPPLACLFCRGRKIACGAPLPGSKTCKSVASLILFFSHCKLMKIFFSQCQKRGYMCNYPAESRRGMRKKKPPCDDKEGDAEVVSKSKRKKKN
jgi:hypothetical protein